MEWRFVWSRGDEHETGRALSVEKIRPVPPRLLRILSPAEREYVRCDEDFFRLWTLKEALIKCRGGVLGQIRHVHFDLSGSSIICSAPGYSFSLLPAPEGYAAALCWEKLEENRHETHKK